MTFDEWVETYKPVKNYTEWGFDHLMFETYGDDWELVYVLPPNRVWTLVEGDTGLFIIEGRHLVNRVGYFVTVKPWSEPVQVPV